MKIWVDAQLPPTLANWLSTTSGLEVTALRDLSLRDAQDIEIFEAARAENAVVMTKDSDFIDLVCRFDLGYLQVPLEYCHHRKLKLPNDQVERRQIRPKRSAKTLLAAPTELLYR